LQDSQASLEEWTEYQHQASIRGRVSLPYASR